MKDRTALSTFAPTTCQSTPSVASPAAAGEFLRGARIDAAQTAVDDTAHRLANTHLPIVEREQLADEHLRNLRHLAILRTEAGIQTTADRRVLGVAAAGSVAA